MKFDKTGRRTMDEYYAISWPETLTRNILTGHALCRAFVQGKDYMRTPDATAWWPGRRLHER